MGILEDILARLEHIETSIDMLGMHANTVAPPVPAPQPAQTTAPAPQPTPSLYAPPTPAAAPGPQPVPTLEELRERLMTLHEQKGADLCISLLRNHQGANAEGSVNVVNVPQEQYAALYGAINQQLGVH